MPTIKIYQSNSYNRKTGFSPIYLSFYLKKEKVVLPVKVSTRKEWFKDGRVMKKDKDFQDKNLIIENMISHVNNIFVKFRLREKSLSKAVFMSQWSTADGFVDFYDFCNWYMLNHSSDVEMETLNNHRTALRKLQSVYPVLLLEDLSQDVIMDFKGHLIKDFHNKHTTVMKNLGFVKKYVLAAYRMKLIEENPFENVKISKSYEEVKLYLTDEELDSLCTLYYKGDLSPRKRKILLFFLFMCFGSMHVGDAKSFMIEQIGEKYISYVRRKTRNSKGVQIYIPISKSLRKVLCEARGRRMSGQLFVGLPSNQKINVALKQIADSVGIKKEMCCKMGRHTFATLFARHTHDLNTLKKLMGHSSYSETLRYAHVVEEDKLKAIHCFDGFM